MTGKRPDRKRYVSIALYAAGARHAMAWKTVRDTREAHVFRRANGNLGETRSETSPRC